MLGEGGKFKRISKLVGTNLFQRCFHWTFAIYLVYVELVILNAYSA